MPTRPGQTRQRGLSRPSKQQDPGAAPSWVLLQSGKEAIRGPSVEREDKGCSEVSQAWKVLKSPGFCAQGCGYQERLQRVNSTIGLCL